MNIIIVDNEQQGAEKAFEQFCKAYRQGATCFGLATGSTPQALYGLICKSQLDFSRCTSINLDEYVGLSPDNKKSYHYFMQEKLFSQKPFAQSFLPNGMENDAEKEVQRYETILKGYPIDFQILGIGRNAHIGFNEPGTPFSQRTHKVKLTDSTIEANKRFFERVEDVPTHAYSMGLQSIMDAKEIMLLAFGETKAVAIRDMIEGNLTEDVPASILQTHQNVTVILDKTAAKLLTK